MTTGQLSVNQKRVRNLKGDGSKQRPGPIILWMSRDQRLADNWALLYALECAQKTQAPVAIAFNLVPAFLGAGARHFGFMLRGLKELSEACAAKGIAFFMLKGDPKDTIPALVADTQASLLITDYSPLRIGREWRKEVACRLPEDVPFSEVDAHNVVPIWVASDKRETGARTIRPKIHKHLPEFLGEYPEVPQAPAAWPTSLSCQPDNGPNRGMDWDALIAEVLQRGASVPEVHWLKPGEAGAKDALEGPNGFLTPARLSQYAAKRNDPSAKALSNLSPYLHYGQLSAQRVALTASKHRGKYKEAVDGFLEELVVRRELADNFCSKDLIASYQRETCRKHAYTPNYDSLDCAAAWARESLDAHRGDKREHLYSRDQLEQGKTADELWNACQMEMVHLGKMHGFMRMYWAKKILEWTTSPELAIEFAIYLNDKYELDGRDPNGYTGIMWSMAGIHDQGWGERAVFGKIRYMNYAGCKRKFDIAAYCKYVDRAVKEELAGKGSNGASTSKASSSGAGGKREHEEGAAWAGAKKAKK